MEKIDKEGINARFRAFIEKIGKSPTRFAWEIKLNHESINRLFRSKILLPSVYVLLKTKIEFPTLNINYILRGEGQMFLSEVDIATRINELENEIKLCYHEIEEKDKTVGNLAAAIRNMGDRK